MTEGREFLGTINLTKEAMIQNTGDVTEEEFADIIKSEEYSNALVEALEKGVFNVEKPRRFSLKGLPYADLRKFIDLTCDLCVYQNDDGTIEIEKKE